ncbi:hypothetical protein RIF29_04377 [Crotalaria pallida]|uniref:Uncharacterized protein n=1 Tax=Crotalaria pallida TaxID=3830 RepID=A0AAN9J1Z2_CROPI
MLGLFGSSDSKENEAVYFSFSKELNHIPSSPWEESSEHSVRVRVPSSNLAPTTARIHPSSVASTLGFCFRGEIDEVVVVVVLGEGGVEGGKGGGEKRVMAIGDEGKNVSPLAMAQRLPHSPSTHCS